MALLELCKAGGLLEPAPRLPLAGMFQLSRLSRRPLELEEWRSGGGGGSGGAEEVEEVVEVEGRWQVGGGARSCSQHTGAPGYLAHIST